jgi:hypothetical protein
VLKLFNDNDFHSCERYFLYPLSLSLILFLVFNGLRWVLVLRRSVRVLTQLLKACGVLYRISGSFVLCSGFIDSDEPSVLLRAISLFTYFQELILVECWVLAAYWFSVPDCFAIISVSTILDM